VRSWRFIPLAAMGFMLLLAALAALTENSVDFGYGWLKFGPANQATAAPQVPAPSVATK
jgi:hypothetical protein